jgi:hypothetical protein
MEPVRNPGVPWSVRFGIPGHGWRASLIAHPTSRTPLARRFAPEDGDELHISMKRTLYSGDPDDKD